MKNLSHPPKTTRDTTGFSLVELLTVMAVISVLAAVTIPALNGLKNSGDFSQSSSDLSSSLEMARAYAMSNNTYTYVGIQEVNGSGSATGDGTGRLVVAVVASQDGTRPYSTLGQLSSNNIVGINKPLFYGSTHLISTGTLGTTGNMSRPSATVDMSILPPSATAHLSFLWPLSSTPATAKYTFNRVIEFDPQGVARTQTSGVYNPDIPAYIEIPLVPAHGTVPISTPANTAFNEAAVQIQGITGAVRAYRP